VIVWLLDLLLPMLSVMGFKATFNNISVIPWLSVLLVEETGVSIENHRPTARHSQSLSHHVVSSTPRQSGIHFQIQIQSFI
jgi:hypothetical protein